MLIINLAALLAAIAAAVLSARCLAELKSGPDEPAAPPPAGEKTPERVLREWLYGGDAR